LPDFSDDLNRCLYATYLSYLDGPDFAYRLDQKTDPRGSLAEFVKAPSAGQIFVSRTKPGITRGNHYHHTKTEKFLVVEGEAVIRFRRVESQALSGKGDALSGKGEVVSAKREGGSGGCQWEDGRQRVDEETDASQRPNTYSPLSASPLPLGPPALIEHRVSGREFKVVDIPPGYTHSIENVGKGELVTLFWASEVFNPAKPDTYPMPVVS